ncbi:hypothetical protein FHP05_02075 [Cerasibacillus terrae]|uniref:Uncharacterized protein n=1 Tax=Cerasibacillus terrae TaxID=2498845 RepID=A0A5C8P2I7_9BACI|nr:hypothetical protein [Cerasibacillus terrae]TXL67830.1 hypothetical protein FHP05_02075 [Cerasibacillus terrae]
MGIALKENDRKHGGVSKQYFKKELKQMEIQLYVLEQKVSLQVNRSLEDYYYEVTNELDSLRQSMSHLEK